MRCSEAQAEVPSPHSGFTRRCPRRSGALHRGTLGRLRLLLAVLWFHGGEEQHLLQTPIASAAAPTRNTTSRAQVSRELPQLRLRCSAAGLRKLSKCAKELFPGGILRLKNRKQLHCQALVSSKRWPALPNPIPCSQPKTSTGVTPRKSLMVA